MPGVRRLFLSLSMGRSKFQPVFILFAVSLFACCAAKHAAPHAGTVVLPYHELGPQVAVHELIGYEWYQWNSHGDSDPNKDDDVKVVIYRNIPLEKVKEMYPVIVGQQDYRYLDYEAAINYLKRSEGEPYLEHLQQTKKKIVEQLGS
jgi:hypothetical protein